MLFKSSFLARKYNEIFFNQKNINLKRQTKSREKKD
jgi:hypothetical protein